MRMDEAIKYSQDRFLDTGEKRRNLRSCTLSGVFCLR